MDTHCITFTTVLHLYELIMLIVHDLTWFKHHTEILAVCKGRYKSRLEGDLGLKAAVEMAAGTFQSQSVVMLMVFYVWVNLNSFNLLLNNDHTAYCRAAPSDSSFLSAPG